MSNNILGILIGGLVPALFYGVFPILTKASIRYNLGTSRFLVIVGIACIVVGLLSSPLLNNNVYKLSFAGIGFAFASGLTWGLGTLLVNVALLKFGTPIAILSPLYNMNTLVTVILGLWIFSEWRSVSMPTLMLGAFFITLGGVILSRA